MFHVNLQGCIYLYTAETFTKCAVVHDLCILNNWSLLHVSFLETLPLLQCPCHSKCRPGRFTKFTKQGLQGLQGAERGVCFHFVLMSINHATSKLVMLTKKLYPSHAQRHCQSPLPSHDPNLHQSFSVALLDTTYTWPRC